MKVVAARQKGSAPPPPPVLQVLEVSEQGLRLYFTDKGVIVGLVEGSLGLIINISSICL